jgi:peptidoglycan/xylan/chitin deacetylase (PgdA/CDA1 family)
LVVPKRPDYFEPTFDIDIAFAHKSKSLILHGLGTASLLLNGNFDTLKTRLKVWRNREIDPYDVFDDVLDVLEEHRLRAVFFAMTANRGKYDKNNNHKKTDYQQLIKKLDRKQVVGLHPSYASTDNPRLVSEEKERLEDIVGHEIIHVRQHFLRQFLPQTWKTYIECGLKHDYSIGYANQCGYKVGTCVPYQAFDVTAQNPLPITLHPFALMDTALWHHQNYTSDQVIELSKMVKSNQERFHSPLSAVWHNYAMPHQSEELEVFKQQLSIFANHD